MKKLWLLALVPFQLDQWTATNFTSKAPVFAETKQEWTISTKDSAGGYVYLLPDVETGDISWEWSVQKFPSARPVFPFDKKNDDYAVRVGVLFWSGGKSLSLPSSMEKILEAKKLVVSHALLYGAVSETSSDLRCGSSPYQDRIVYCPKPARTEITKTTVSPIRDIADALHLDDVEKKRLRIVGFWVFADSDNSSSESVATLRNLEIEKVIREQASPPKRTQTPSGRNR
jgi:hypothetical protein